MDELAVYDFVLPQELIAQEPLPNRTDARLMVVCRGNGTIEHRHIRDLPDYLNKEDTLVLNNTKVVPARLIGARSKTGGDWEGLFLGQEPDGCWRIFCKTRGKLIAGEMISLRTPNNDFGFPLELVEKNSEDGSWTVKPRTSKLVFQALEEVGWVPIPPYIRQGRMSARDRENYQTVYAKEPGAIAAPTAGLHFTPELLVQLQNRGIVTVPLTLHVGSGTFRPITVSRLAEHEMHAEWCSVKQSTVETILERRQLGGRTVAVGTTSVRVLETVVTRFGTLAPFSGETNLFIRPPYDWKMVDVLLTNFHFPKSTLYILVRTFGGDELIQAAYEEAIRRSYRFFSYGDAMLIL